MYWISIENGNSIQKNMKRKLGREKGRDKEKEKWKRKLVEKRWKITEEGEKKDEWEFYGTKLVYFSFNSDPFFLWVF